MDNLSLQINSGAQTELPEIFKYQFNGTTKNAVSVRELYRRLGLKDGNFLRWTKINIEEIFIQGEEWSFPLKEVNAARSQKSGRKLTDYVVPVDIAKELAMLARTEQGKTIRRQFIDIEKKFVSVIQQQAKKIEIGEETSKFFNNLIESASIYSPTVKITLGALISEKVYGIKVPVAALPSANQPRIMAFEIAKQVGSNPKRIGMIAKILNLQRMPYAERKWTMTPGLTKEVQVWYYGEEAVKLIKEYFYNQSNNDV